MNAWINVEENEPVLFKMTEDKITFSAQQEPQSELESDDDDDDEEPELMPSMIWNNIETSWIVREFNTFWYNALQL